MSISAESLKQWQEEMLASYPENYGNKAIEFVENSHPSKLVLDHGVHCTCCGRREEDGMDLISNPEIPRVICIECYTWALLELKDRVRDNDQNSGGNQSN